MSPFNPLTLSVVLLAFLGVSLAASLIPAVRAGRVDPLNVLRSD